MTPLFGKLPAHLNDFNDIKFRFKLVSTIVLCTKSYITLGLPVVLSECLLESFVPFRVYCLTDFEVYWLSTVSVYRSRTTTLRRTIIHLLNYLLCRQKIEYFSLWCGL